MPLYEYRCHKCGQVFEVLQKFADAPLDTHVACGGVVERLLSTPSFQFKGSGFYITDYGNNKHSSNGSANGSGNGSGNGHDGHEHNGKEAPAKTEKPASTTTASTKPSGTKPSGSSEPAAKR